MKVNKHPPRADFHERNDCGPPGGAKVWRAVLMPATMALLLVVSAQGGQKSTTPRDLTELSLEDLLSIEVTSVARKEQKLSHTAAAVYVVTQEDIRRSGATSIPEAIRMVPGLQVAQLDANKWAISSRGFNDRFANKLLVLLDGRTIYTPLFSGVHWDMHDVLIEDIERIEVIRGPGAVMWGSNAVNGVISIITKRAEDTQGSLVTSGAGNQESAFGSLRSGGKLGAGAHYRIYSKYFQRDDQAAPSGGERADSWNALRSGFRLDWDGPARDSVTVQGDLFDGNAGQTLNLASLQPPFARTIDDNVQRTAGNILGRWKRRLSDTSYMALQTYYDRSQRRNAVTAETRDTFDADFTHRATLSGRSELLWGAGFRTTSDQIGGTFDVSFHPAGRTANLYSTFVQHEWAAVEDRLVVTTGTRFEHNSYSGFEFQPNVRLLWIPNQRHTGWASIARAVRSPSRSDRDIRINFAAFPKNGLTNVLAIFGNPDLRAENLLAYEAGYRLEAATGLSIDVASFYNTYSDLKTQEPAAPFLQAAALPHLVIPTRFSNQMRGETYGLEAAVRKSVLERWKVSASYTWLEMQLHRDSSSRDNRAEEAEGASPEHQFQVRSYLDLPWNLQFDTAAYYVGPLPALRVPSYTRVDARIGWTPQRVWSVSVGLQNLLDGRHPEFFAPNGGFVRSEVRRSIYGKVTWRF